MTTVGVVEQGGKENRGVWMKVRVQSVLKTPLIYIYIWRAGGSIVVKALRY